ncbi:glycosyltransferase [Flavobacteriaceae bacterium XHP0103]|uniref:glycosyltransferase family 2 protein n=1 Tax=Marixanthotalea marina TaxID=2844359 RepID=UPI002989FBCA|nr:glycosyltransferase [Marixanthotalea marina]MBU3822002.1 glycosyltransferase [Marixanthotalea marina]
MLLIGFAITLLYALLIGSFILGFNKVPLFHLKRIPSKTTFSVVVPFRNEAENLPILLESIQNLNYPKELFEVILVDDDSEDESVELIVGFLANARTDVTIINNVRKTNAPKKDAITTAINNAKHEWIVTTDADCTLPEFWLNSFNAFIQETNTKCIVAPVKYHDTIGFLNAFQTLDFLSLQGATIGGFGINKPFLCNGANFGYKKSLFFELNGFKGNSTIASGDDIFLLEKVAKTHPNNLHYLKCNEAIVSTQTQKSWKHLFSQRLRWSAKTSNYKNAFGKLTGLIVFLMNAFVVLSILFCLFNLFSFKSLLYILVLKLYVDFLLLYKTASFFNSKHVLKSYLLGFLVYPFFSVFIALTSVFKSYTWKDRTFKK